MRGSATWEWLTTTLRGAGSRIRTCEGTRPLDLQSNAFDHSAIPARLGADTRNRTGDLILTMDALYRLSYVGVNATKHKLSRVLLYAIIQHLATSISSPLQSYGLEAFPPLPSQAVYTLYCQCLAWQLVSELLRLLRTVEPSGKTFQVLLANLLHFYPD